MISKAFSTVTLITMMLAYAVSSSKVAYFKFEDCGGTDALWKFKSFDAPKPWPLGTNVSWSFTGTLSQDVTNGTAHFTSPGLTHTWNVCDDYLAHTWGGGEVLMPGSCGKAGAHTQHRWTSVSARVPPGNWPSTFHSMTQEGKTISCLVSTLVVAWADEVALSSATKGIAPTQNLRG